MIDIKKKEDCCGCGACYDACAKGAIVWEPDNEGFSYPRVDTDKCVNCGLCNKVCPIENSDTLNVRNASNTPTVLGAYHKDENIRFTSTSGGAFWGLAEGFVKNGGYVAGAVFADHFKIKHIVTNDLEELKRIKGSKYAQGDCRGMYKRIAELLKAGEKVMATGLPCQMAALRQFIRKDYDNLLIVDLICHSVSSPLAFEKYVEWLEKTNKSEMVKYHPKNKEYGGWHKFAFKAYFRDGAEYVRKGINDPYTEVAYGSNNVLCRYSCYECHFKHVPQPSDITIGDFWGIQNVDSSFDSPKGVSKIMLNTKKGQEYFSFLDTFVTKQYTVEESITSNPRSWSMIKSVSRCDQKMRDAFVTDLHKDNFEYAVVKHLKTAKSIKQKILRNVRLLRLKYL